MACVVHTYPVGLATAAGTVVAIASVLAWRSYSLAAGYRAYFATLLALAIAWTIAKVGRSHRGPRLQLVSLALTIATIAVGNYVVIDAMVHQFAVRHGQEVPHLIGAEMFSKAWGQLYSPRDWLFFGVGCALGGLIPRRRPPQLAR